MDFRVEIINLREFEAEPLLASDDWADIALALLDWATERLRSASGEELHVWAKRVLHSASLDETLQ